MSTSKTLNRLLLVIGITASILIAHIPRSAHAVSFSVDDLAVGSGSGGSGLAIDVGSSDPDTRNHIYFNDHTNNGNTRDVSASSIGSFGSANINALSKGNDVLEQNANQLGFSVTAGSVGASGTEVNVQSTGNGAAGDIFLVSQNNIGQQELAVDAVDLGLAATDNIDAFDVFDPSEPNLTVFTDHIYLSLDSTSGSFGAEDILFSDGAGNVSLFADGIVDIGLVSGDNIDALVLDTNTNTALFSLASGSTSLGGSFSGADIFRTSFSGSFTLDISAAELGLLASDDLDALEFNHISDIPEPSTVLLTLGSLVAWRRLRQRNLKS